ncbi:MAG: site-specific integrase [Acidobacteria bacterium]|nr:site-specific integrase [Acidobacteriota bacterium]
MGVTVREKAKGSNQWWVFINHGGRRTSRKVGSEKAALEVAKKIEAKLILGEAFLQEKKPAVPTLDEYYERFKRTYMRTLKESSQETYHSSFKNHILPKLGRLCLDQIDRALMEEYTAALVEKDLAKDSITMILSPLGVLYTDAIEKNIVSDNPTLRLRKFYRQAPKRHEEIEPLSQEESLLFLQTTQQHAPNYYTLFLLALHTGLRSGEIAGLQWIDIDWNGKYLKVRRAIVRRRLTTVKTRHGRRRVDLSDDLIGTLADLRKKMQEECLKKGSNTIPEWVFANRYGGWVEMSNVKQKNFKNVLRKAGLRSLRFHDLRHSFASLLLANGAPITYVSNQLGHANSQITLKVYAHWIPDENQRNAVNRLPSLSKQSESAALAK